MILAVTLCVSCRKDNREATVSDMYGRTVIIDTAYFEKLDGRYDSPDSGYTHSLVVFYDSTECMSCALTKIHGWNKLITEYEPKGVNFIFILAPERDEAETMSIWFEAEHFIHSVYIDSSQTFIQNNTWIPDEKMYHTFLIDSDNKIVLVGDPRRYVSLMKLFEKTVSE